MRSHYRGHKMSLWLSLIPQLHRPGSDLPDAAMRHHHFQDENANYYEGMLQYLNKKVQQLLFLHNKSFIVLLTKFLRRD